MSGFRTMNELGRKKSIDRNRYILSADFPNPESGTEYYFINKLNKLHERSQRRRKPTKAQRKKAYMHSDMVIREITQSMMPEKI